MCMRVSVCVSEGAHHQGLGQDVLYELEVVAELLALGAGALRLLVGIETEELRLVFELALLQDWRRTRRQRQGGETA